MNNLASQFEVIVAKQPKIKALLFEQHQINYVELNVLANQFASRLKQYSCQTHDVICISSKKTIDKYALIIACWKLGITYSIFDEESPNARLSHIFECCQPTLVISENPYSLSRFQDQQLIDFDEFSKTARNLFPQQHYSYVLPTTIAYIMFTSGSTGKPKGVAISHQNLLQFVDWGQECYQFTKNDRLLGLNPLYFDNSVFDTYMSLLNGLSLIPINGSEIKQPKKVVSIINQFEATTWFSVPSLIVYFLKFKALTENTTPTIKRFIFGGEGFAKAQLFQLYQNFQASHISLSNVYGPTECTCICSNYPITKNDFTESNMQQLAPLGFLNNNFTGYVLDKNLQLVPDGEIGELYLGGNNVGAGYYNAPELTSEKFIQNPTHNLYRDIVYRTGDLVYRDSKNQMYYFSGRTDSQIKYMGYRIELGEIEAVLSAHQRIEESAVLFGTIQENGVIFAFVVSSINEDEIRQYLQEKLPSYMVPRKILVMAQLPKNANGKIDKRVLTEEFAQK